MKFRQQASKYLFYFLLLALCPLTSSAQLTNTSNFEAELQKVLDDYQSDNNLQSITAAVLFENGEIFQGANGFSYGEVEMDTSLLVGIGSNTKLFTAVLSVMLASEGYFDLDDSISKWLEPIQYVDPSITIRQLLQHNSGVNDFIGNTDIYPTQILNEPNKVWTPEETLTYIFEPITSPNNGVYYSNANYILIGMIIEKATGALYHELLRSYIIDPLQLEDIYFEGFEEVEGEIAHPFLFGFDYSSTPRIALGTTTWSAGFMVSKPKTLVKWYDALFNESFLSEEELNIILDFIPWPDDNEGREMGLGIYLINIEEKIYYGHGGRTVGFTSFTLFDKNCGNSISVAINMFFADAYTLALSLGKKACELNTSTSSEESRLTSISVYPNPASDYIYTSGANEIKVFDLEGRLVASSNGPVFSVQHLLNGIYFVQLSEEGKLTTRRIVIQH